MSLIVRSESENQLKITCLPVSSRNTLLKNKIESRIHFNKHK